MADLECIFGALVILSQDKKSVLAVPQRDSLHPRISMRFPGTTVPIRMIRYAHAYAAAERIVRHDGAPENIMSRVDQLLAEGLEDISRQNWGPEVNSFFEEDWEAHGKYFRGFIMTPQFDWELVRSEEIPKRSDPYVTLEKPRLVPLKNFTDVTSKFSVPRAHSTVANKLQGIIHRHVCID